MLNRQTWRTHQSVGAKKRGRGKCCWENCPGLKLRNAKRKRSYNTVMICKQCSAKAESNEWLCLGQKGDDVLPCHIEYHKKHFNKEFPLTAGGGYTIALTLKNHIYKTNNRHA